MPKFKQIRKRVFGRKAKQQARQMDIVMNAVADSQVSKRSRKRPSSDGTSTIVYDIGSTLGNGTTTIVCDIGSAWTRIGFASSRLPPLEMPSLVGRITPDSQRGRIRRNDFFVLGDEAKQLRHMSSFSKPVRSGRIADVDAVSFILGAGFRGIGALTDTGEDLSGRNLLIALRPSEHLRTKETLFQTLMETYRIDGCYFGLQQPLALYATQPARLTGLVLDSGVGVTQAVPVYDGHAVHEAIETVILGGDDVTDRLLAHLAQEYDYRVRSLRDRDVVDRMKEALAIVSPSPGRAPANLSAGAFQLPGRRNVILRDERYLCAEPLFNPNLIGRKGVGIAAAVTLALGKCEPFMRRELAENILCLGGNSKLRGFDQRLQAELDRKYAGIAVVRRPSASAKQTTIWSGGAAFARTPAFADIVVTREEYNEEGIRAFHNKCC